MAVGALTLYAAGQWLSKRGVLGAPVLRRRGVNLEATRPGSAPRMWLCAHLDTKSQPIPTLVRIAGVVVEGLGFALTLALAIAAALGVAAHAALWVFAAAVTLVGAVPVVLSMVGSRSAGALDNASGVVTVLLAARRLGDQPGVGVLITDAEELGLAGARAWCRSHEKKVVLNCDGVDDDGAIQVMFTGRRPAALLGAVARASAGSGIPHQARRLALGVLTDSVAFADAGWSAVTFSRGSLRSFGRVHSSRDDLSRLRGDGLEPTATLLAGSARVLLTSVQAVKPSNPGPE